MAKTKKNKKKITLQQPIETSDGGIKWSDPTVIQPVTINWNSEDAILKWMTRGFDFRHGDARLVPDPPQPHVRTGRCVMTTLSGVEYELRYRIELVDTAPDETLRMFDAPQHPLRFVN